MVETLSALSGAGTVLVLAMLLVLLFWMTARQRRVAVRVVAMPDRGLGYLCNAVPLAKAEPALLDRFPGLAAAAATAPMGMPVSVVRCGFFNRSGEAVAADAFAEPPVLRFREGAQVLHAAFAEALKTDLPDGEIRVSDAVAALPPFALAAGGTVIVHLVVAGAREPDAVIGSLRDGGPIRRLM